MTLAFHAPVDGWLRRLDARWKIAGIVTLAVGVMALADALCALLAAVAAIALARSANVPLRRLLRKITPVVGMLTLLFLGPLFRPAPEDPTWNLFGLPISPVAGWLLLRLLAKATAFLTLITALTETTPMPELGQGAAALGIPRFFIHLVLLTQRYILVIADEFSRLRRALRVRGFRSRFDGRTFATIGNVAGSLFVRGHERSERVYHAMAARGFDGSFRSLAVSQTHRADVAFFATSVFLTALLLVWDRGWWPA